MKDYVVSIQITQVYHVAVSASSAEAAKNKVDRMQTTEIREVGSLKDVSTDHLEVIG